MVGLPRFSTHGPGKQNRSRRVPLATGEPVGKLWPRKGRGPHVVLRFWSPCQIRDPPAPQRLASLVVFFASADAPRALRVLERALKYTGQGHQHVASDLYLATRTARKDIDLWDTPCNREKQG